MRSSHDFVGSDFRRGVAEHERGDEVRTLATELLRDHAADRHADDRGPADAKDPEKRGQVARIVGHLSMVRAGFGQPMAALVVADDPEIGLQDASDVGPDAQVAAERIDEDQRREPFRTLDEIVDRRGRSPA